MKQQPRLFDELNAPYYVYAPPFTRTSGGVRAMHQLCHALNLLGEEAYVTAQCVSDRFRTPILTGHVLALHNEVQKRKPIVIYPEVVNDNPHGAEHVVRYLLNLPGFLVDGEIAWGENDMLFAHGTDVIPSGMDADLLQLPLVDTQIYNTIGVDDSQREGNLVFINRYVSRGGELSPVTDGCTEISFRAGARSPEELAKLYRSSKLMYTYEASTACYEALLCGCAVVYLPNEIMLPKPMHHYLRDAGSAWGNSPEQIEHALSTLKDVPVIYEELHQGFWRELESFIDKTQQRVREAKAAAAAVAAAVAVPVAAPVQAVQQSPQVPPQQARTQTPLPPLVARQRRVAVLSVESADAAGSITRLTRPFALGDQAWELVWGVENGEIRIDALRSADLIVLHGTIAARLSVESLEQIFGLNVPVVYDTDAPFDLAHDPAVDPARAKQWRTGVEYAVRHARLVSVANESLADGYRSAASAVQVVADKLDFDLFSRLVREDADVVHIAVAGKSLDPANFALVDRALHELDARFGHRIKLTFFGATRPEGWSAHAGVTFVEAPRDLASYADHLRNLDADIALIPRAANAFNDAASMRPALEFAAAGAAVLTSPRVSCCASVEPGLTGLIVGDSAAEWLDAIVSLIEQPALRRQLARTAQAVVLKRHDLSAFPSDLRCAWLTALGEPVESHEPGAGATSGQDVLRGVLILDRDGDARRVDATLASLAASPFGKLMTIVLTTRGDGVPEWTSRLRYVKASSQEFAAGRDELSVLASFDWAMIIDAGSVVAASTDAEARIADSVAA